MASCTAACTTPNGVGVFPFKSPGDAAKRAAKKEQQRKSSKESSNDGQRLEMQYVLICAAKSLVRSAQLYLGPSTFEKHRPSPICLGTIHPLPQTPFLPLPWLLPLLMKERETHTERERERETEKVRGVVRNDET